MRSFACATACVPLSCEVRGLHHSRERVYRALLMRKNLAIAACVLSLVPALIQAQVITGAVPAVDPAATNDITRLRDQYVAAMNAGDAIALTEFFAQDAVFVPRHGMFLKGRDEILRYFAKAYQVSEAPRRHVTIRTFKTEQGATMAWESGRFEESDNAGGATHSVGGVYVIIYSRDAFDRWRVAVEVRSHGNRDAVVPW